MNIQHSSDLIISVDKCESTESLKDDLRKPLAAIL